VLWDEQWGLVISEGSKTSDPALQELRADFRRRSRNEERAIWYVALTRAQERLIIVHSGCALAEGEFADARAKLERSAAGAAPTRDDEAVHFFHELWQQVRSAPPDPLVRLYFQTTETQP
jgi:ATP-dependent exoDNAse (exonuclease V) beta subunit